MVFIHQGSKSNQILKPCPIGLLAVMGMIYVSFFHLGYNTLMVNAHYGIFIATLFLMAFLLDAVFFTVKPSKMIVSLLKFSSALLVLLITLIVVTGILADINFVPAVVSSSSSNLYGNFTANVTSSSLGNFR